jgi:hypothetical protein
VCTGLWVWPADVAADVTMQAAVHSGEKERSGRRSPCTRGRCSGGQVPKQARVQGQTNVIRQATCQWTRQAAPTSLAGSGLLISAASLFSCTVMSDLSLRTHSLTL